MHEMLYEELRQSEQEILLSLKKPDNQLKMILEAELADIRSALEKAAKGCYGFCEISGELIPDSILLQLPTIKSLNDLSHLESFYRKPIHFDS